MRTNKSIETNKLPPLAPAEFDNPDAKIIKINPKTSFPFKGKNGTCLQVSFSHKLSAWQLESSLQTSI